MYMGKWLFIFLFAKICSCFFVFFLRSVVPTIFFRVCLSKDQKPKRLKSALGMPLDSAPIDGGGMATKNCTQTTIYLYIYMGAYLICWRTGLGGVGRRSNKYYPCIFHIIRSGAFFCFIRQSKHFAIKQTVCGLGRDGRLAGFQIYIIISRVLDFHGT